MNASDLKPDKKFHGIFVGKSGSGKTCASITVGDRFDEAGKCVHMSSVYVFDVDDRIKGIMGLPILKEKLASGKIEFDNFKAGTYNESADKISSKLAELKNLTATGKIETVIYSSTTSTTELFRNQARASDAIKHNVLLGRVMTQVQDYGYIDRAQRDVIIGDLKKLSCNVIIESHLKDDGYTKTGDSGEEVFIKTGEVINLPGKLSHDAPTWFDETYEFYIDDLVKAAPRYMVVFKGKLAKTSFPNMPVEMNWTGKNFFQELMKISQKGHK